MRIFVTGATGYLGAALCRRLAAAGHELRCLVRRPAVAAPLEALGAACFVGDVTDRYSLREGMSGADWVIHAAAVVDPEAHPGRLAAVNVAGAENVASLAYKLGVGRFLSVSSMAFFGGSPADGSAADEDSPVLQPLPDPYSASKHAGQRAIEEWASRGLRLNTVYPSLVYGPPGKPRGANALLGALLAGRFPLLVGGDRYTSWVFLEDVVDGMVRVLERAPPARSYLLTGDATTVRGLAERVARLGGAAVPRWELPLSAARVLVRAGSAVARLAGHPLPVSPRQLASLERHWRFDDARARRELDWRPRSLEEGLPPTLALLRGDRQPSPGGPVAGGGL